MSTLALLAAVFLLNDSPATGTLAVAANVRVEINTDAAQVFVTGENGSRIITVTATEGFTRPAMTESGGVVRIVDAGRLDEISHARYDIKVPAGAHVTLKCLQCKAKFSNIDAVSAETDSGNLVAEDILGDADISSLFGTVRAERVAGAVNAASQTSLVSVIDVRGAVTARSTTGTIKLYNVTAGATAVNTTGEVHLRGPVGSAATYDLETHSGHIRIYLEPGAGATIDVNTPEHTLRRDPQFALKSSDRDRRTTLTIGSASARISARALYGAVDVRQNERANQSRPTNADKDDPDAE